jgi:hypothetical protein
MATPYETEDAPRPTSYLRIGLIVAAFLVVSCGGLVVIVSTAASALTSGRTAARRVEAENDLKQIGSALHQYESAHGEFPPAVVYDGQGKPLYSWRVLLLPYLDQARLAAEFHYDEPWDSPHNQSLLPRCPRVYRHPLATNADPSLTYFRVFDGPGAAFESDPRSGFRPFVVEGKPLQRGKARISLRDFPDGLENTFLVVEAADPVPWTKPDELAFVPGQPLPRLGGLAPKLLLAGFADGHTDRLAQDTPENILRAYITRNGNDPAPAR